MPGHRWFIWLSRDLEQVGIRNSWRFYGSRIHEHILLVGCSANGYTMAYCQLWILLWKHLCHVRIIHIHSIIKMIYCRFEKYNATVCRFICFINILSLQKANDDEFGAGSGGEYEVQVLIYFYQIIIWKKKLKKGFGWTNGVILDLLDKYGTHISVSRAQNLFESCTAIKMVLCVVASFLTSLLILGRQN